MRTTNKTKQKKFPEEGIAIVKDKYFTSISDTRFRKLLIYSGLIDELGEITQWSRTNQLLSRSLGFMAYIGAKLEVEPDRFSPSASMTMAPSKGIHFIKSLIDRIGNRDITFGDIMDRQFGII